MTLSLVVSKLFVSPTWPKLQHLPPQMHLATAVLLRVVDTPDPLLIARWEVK